MARLCILLIPGRQESCRLSLPTLLRFSRGYHEDPERLPCPWNQNYPNATKADPYLHRLVGTLLLKRIVTGVSGDSFNMFTFGEGVKHAVKTVIHEIPYCHKSEYLTSHLGTDLYQYFRKALDILAHKNKQFNLEIEDLGDWSITGVRAVFGSGDPLDEYVVGFLGQQLVTTRSVIDDVSTDFGVKQIVEVLREGKKLGQQSIMQGIHFQVNVSFRSLERAFISTHGRSIFEDRPKDATVAYHNWLFESPVAMTGSGYPLQWKIVDIDNVCRKRKNLSA